MHQLAKECLGLTELVTMEARPLPDDSGWCVEIRWPDGRLEVIGTFDLQSTAKDWIEWDAPKFLRSKFMLGREE